jgi:hypothetical protein
MCASQTHSPAAPRPLNSEERLVLELLFAHEFPGASELRAQIPHVVVSRQWQVGLPSVDLETAFDGPIARIEGRVAPAEGEVISPDGSPAGFILVWLDEGKLAGLEYAWVTDDRPTGWPSSDLIRVILAEPGESNP